MTSLASGGESVPSWLKGITIFKIFHTISVKKVMFCLQFCSFLPFIMNLSQKRFFLPLVYSPTHFNMFQKGISERSIHALRWTYAAIYKTMQLNHIIQFTQKQELSIQKQELSIS